MLFTLSIFFAGIGKLSHNSQSLSDNDFFIDVVVLHNWDQHWRNNNNERRILRHPRTICWPWLGGAGDTPNPRMLLPPSDDDSPNEISMVEETCAIAYSYHWYEYCESVSQGGESVTVLVVLEWIFFGAWNNWYGILFRRKNKLHLF